MEEYEIRYYEEKKCTREKIMRDNMRENMLRFGEWRMASELGSERWGQWLLVQGGLVSLVLGYDARPIGPDVEIHAERLPRTEESLRALRSFLDAQATLQRAVTESTETNF